MITRDDFDHVKTVQRPNCACDVEAREKPWIISGDQQHAPRLLVFICLHCEHEIRL